MGAGKGRKPMCASFMSRHQVGHGGSTLWRGFRGILCTCFALVLTEGHTG